MEKFQTMVQRFLHILHPDSINVTYVCALSLYINIYFF